MLKYAEFILAVLIAHKDDKVRLHIEELQQAWFREMAPDGEVFAPHADYVGQ